MQVYWYLHRWDIGCAYFPSHPRHSNSFLQAGFSAVFLLQENSWSLEWRSQLFSPRAMRVLGIRQPQWSRASWRNLVGLRLCYMSQEDVDSATTANTLGNRSVIKMGYFVLFSLSSACRRKLVRADMVAPRSCVHISGALALSILLLLHCSKVLPLAVWSKMAH